MDVEELIRINQELQRKLDQHVATIDQHEATIEQLGETLDEKERRIASLQYEIKRLLKTVRGSRQEKIDPDQLMLFSLEELEQLADELREDPEAPNEVEDDLDASGADGKPRPKRGRRKLPENLPREIIRHELDAEQLPCPCCGKPRQEFAVKTSEQLEFVPGYWKIIQHDRVTYRCGRCEEQIETAPKPPQPIEKGVPGPGLCAHLVVSKFGDHQPLYRGEDIFSRLGWPVRRSTMCGWLQSLALLSMPLVMRMKHLVLQSKVIHTDDTKIKMLDPGAGKCREAKFWPYLGDWLHPYAVYDFTIDRSRDGPTRFLSGYAGYLQADAYSGYDGIYAGGDVHEVACWVHARRYWYEAIDNDAVRANTALGFIARLSQIEKELRLKYPARDRSGERDFAAIAEARQKYSVPILDDFKSWLDSEQETGRVLPKSVLSKAFTYTGNQWAALCRYTEEGYLSFDNNAAERLVKVAAIGRKNYLFVGGLAGGHNAAAFYSLISSAKACGVEPWAWLKDVYTRLPYHRDGDAFVQSECNQPVTSEELDELLPDRWLASHPEHRWEIDRQRRKERERKERRKARRRKRR